MRTIGKIFHSLAVFVAAATLSMPAIAAETETSPDPSARAILVLDGSGSMWGRIGDTPKIAIAQTVIRDLMKDWDKTVELGITAYGHREKGNCADIETLIPVGPIDRNKVMSAVKGISPKGKTPLTDAVRQAAEALRYTEERATVILVSDGLETCNADPCAVAEELEASGVDFTVHVVGFDLNDEEKAQLQCMAGNTGGKFLSADSAPELHKAMAATVKLVAKPEPAKKRVVKIQAAAAGSILVKNLTSGLVYVYEPGKTYKDDVARFASNTKTPEQLRPGTYVLGTPKHEITRVDIGPGKEVIVDMNDHTGSFLVKKLTSGLVYVYEPGKTYKDDVARFASNSKTPEQLLPGTYVVGTPKHEITRVDIGPGKEVIVDMNDHTGSFLVKKLTSGLVYVYEPGKTYKDDVARFASNSKTPEQLLPGTYVVGTRKHEITRVDIGPGKEVIVDMNDHTGSLLVKNVISGLIFVYEPGKTYKDDIARFSSNSKTPEQLLPGTYVLGTTKQDLATVEVKAGEELIVELGE